MPSNFSSRFAFGFLVAVCFGALAPSAAFAQSLVVGIPNTDTTPVGTTMIAHESQLNTWSQPGVYWNSFTFATRGVTENVELAATLYGLGVPFGGKVAATVGYKVRLPFAPESEWVPTIALGQMLAVSLTGDGLGGWVYANGSFRIPGLRTRLTAGASFGTRQVFGRDVVSAMFGIEQPIIPLITLVADWFSGSHDLAALIPGVQFNIVHGFIVIAGVKIPNSPAAGPFAAMVEVTYDF